MWPADGENGSHLNLGKLGFQSSFWRPHSLLNYFFLFVFLFPFSKVRLVCRVRIKSNHEGNCKEKYQLKLCLQKCLFSCLFGEGKLSQQGEVNGPSILDGCQNAGVSVKMAVCLWTALRYCFQHVSFVFYSHLELLVKTGGLNLERIHFTGHKCSKCLIPFKVKQSSVNSRPEFCLRLSLPHLQLCACR